MSKLSTSDKPLTFWLGETVGAPMSAMNHFWADPNRSQLARNGKDTASALKPSSPLRQGTP